MSESFAKSYQQFSEQIQQKFFLDLISGIEKKSGLRIVDLGCGTGNNEVILEHLTDSKGHIIAIDPIEDRINIAREKYEDNLVTFYCSDGEHLLMYANDVDLVISNLVIHWISRDEKPVVFDTVFKSLKPGGKFIFNSCIKLPFYFEKFATMLPETIGSRIIANFCIESEEYFKELALKCGFEVEKLDSKLHDFQFQGTAAEFILWMASTLYLVELNEVKEMIAALEADIQEKMNNGSFSFQTLAFSICLKKPLNG